MMIIDVNKLQEQFNEVIGKSQYIDGEVFSDEVFKNWVHNKSRFIEKWGGLTYELDEDIVLDLPEEDKRLHFEEYVCDCACFAERGTEVKEFLLSQTVAGLYQNKVLNRFESGDIKINAGAKISKSLKFFFDDSRLLDKFQTRLSRMIQDCKITGRMVMSVHPLDFLSTSETAHNWHSCHALDGEYRAGNISHMQDPHTFIIYLKADGDYVLPCFPDTVKWNSKKWRVLMYMGLGEDIIVSGRQYPFSNQYAFDKATAELIGKFYPIQDMMSWKNVERSITRIMQDDIGAMQYNDCLNSPSYSPIAMMTEEVERAIEDKEYERMSIGRAVQCLECGGMNISMPSDVRCDECGDYCYCEYCGDACHHEDMYDLDGDLVCEDCYDSNGTLCDGCDEVFNDYVTIMTWDEETECYYCPSCHEDLMESRMEAEHVSYEGEL